MTCSESELQTFRCKGIGRRKKQEMRWLNSRFYIFDILLHKFFLTFMIDFEITFLQNLKSKN